MSWQTIVLNLLIYGFLAYSIVIISFYIFIGIYSVGETIKYMHKNSFVDYRLLAVSPEAPAFSVIAPAYNEGVTIIENVRSLLSIYYNELELIIVNDGSKDDTLHKLIEAYDLEKCALFVNVRIPVKPVRGVYKSRNPVFHKLIVVDKENGGKADALNAGLNMAAHELVVCIDVDCVLEQDALLKMAKPFLENPQINMIAVGGVVRVANSCKIENGRLVKVVLPESWIARFQVLEYMRAFLLGRMAWSRLNGLLLISGAFGAFKRQIAIACGGYSTKTVGEDMELVVRMRRFMEEKKEPYKVAYIPDPLCWTEVPTDMKILGRQRNRWTRGTIETLWRHKRLFFNRRYGLLGMLSYPYWFFFEFLAPLLEGFGFILIIIFALSGLINWIFFLSMLFFILSFEFLYSAFAILMEGLTYNQYPGGRDTVRLLFTAFIEPFVYHPLVVWFAVRGNIDLWRRQSGWGEMTRKGFQSTPKMF
ncbi:MAG: glycosyltransferase family 2 protein [Chitinophagaceae bacterium]|nr:MAG: glycosyltransferase family 2 protein [Chitinophagaceae bacterium]